MLYYQHPHITGHFLRTVLLPFRAQSGTFATRLGLPWRLASQRQMQRPTAAAAALLALTLLLCCYSRPAAAWVASDKCRDRLAWDATPAYNASTNGTTCSMCAAEACCFVAGRPSLLTGAQFWLTNKTFTGCVAAAAAVVLCVALVMSFVQRLDVPPFLWHFAVCITTSIHSAASAGIHGSARGLYSQTPIEVAIMLSSYYHGYRRITIILSLSLCRVPRRDRQYCGTQDPKWYDCVAAGGGGVCKQTPSPGLIALIVMLIIMLIAGFVVFACYCLPVCGRTKDGLWHWRLPPRLQLWLDKRRIAAEERAQAAAEAAAMAQQEEHARYAAEETAGHQYGYEAAGHRQGYETAGHQQGYVQGDQPTFVIVPVHQPGYGGPEAADPGQQPQQQYASAGNVASR